MVTAEVLSMGAQCPRRIVFYSHDTVGLGHIRRNIALAAALVRTDVRTDVLLITGNPEAAALPRPANTDIVTVPTVAKDSAGGYRSRSLRSALHHVLEMRSAVIEAAVGSFRPDLFVVDKVPLGVGQELLATLTTLRDDPQRRTSVVLGLREILDDPVTAVREWTLAQSTQVIEDYYDAIWVYGDRRVYDPVLEYGLPPEVASKVSYTGYLVDDRDVGLLVPPADPLDPPPLPPQRPYLLCMVGGGQDGFELSHAFVRTALPPGYLGVAICGPFMPPDERRRVHATAAARADMIVYDFVSPVESFLDGATAVVSMAGYNSACEVVAAGRRALLVPRTWLRLEQRIRAERLAELGLVDVLPADQLGEERLARWLSAAVAEQSTPTAPDVRTAIDTGGLHRVPELAAELIARRTVERLNHAAA
jgi:predicted glycosyltransferase